MAAQAGAHQLRPAVAGELAGEEPPLAAQFLGLGVDVVHEFVDEGDGDLLDLALGVGHLAHEDVAGGVDSAFGFAIQHEATLTWMHRMDRIGASEAFEFKARVAEVDEQSDVDTGCVQVVDDLGLVLREQGFDGFEFNDNLLFYEQVGDKISNGLTTKMHRNRFLGFHRQPLV